MRKDITKKFLGKENRYLGKMLSKDIVAFIARRKINIDVKQIGYDVIEFRNVFSIEFTNLNTKNILESGYMFKEVVRKNGKRKEFNMIYCDKGTFTMGSDNPKDNNPKKQVEIEKPFLLGETEVTQELYKFVMGYNPSEFQGKEDSSKRPVEMVTWYDAIMFCNKLSELLGKNPYYEIKDVEYHDKQHWKNNIKKASVEINEGANGFRLPLLKEWEYAAKTDTNNRWAGTNDKSKLEEYAWFGESSHNGSTHPVATKKPNEWGFYDMSGNVWEWCWDRHALLNIRFAHGGSWRCDVLNLHSTLRSYTTSDRHNDGLGFRVSATL